MNTGDIPLALANQGTRNGRADGNQAGVDIGFHLADNLVRHLRFLLQVQQINGGTKDHLAVGIDVGDINDLGIGQIGFYLRNPPLDETLLFLGGMIFGILAEIAVCPCFGNSLNNPRPLLTLQVIELLPQFFCALCCNRYSGVLLTPSCSSCNRLARLESCSLSARIVAVAPAMVVV